jgi:hypothetical protein
MHDAHTTFLTVLRRSHRALHDRRRPRASRSCRNRSPETSTSHPAATDRCQLERFSSVVKAREVPAYDIVGDLEKSTMRTFGALDTRLLAYAANPLVRAGGCVTGLTGLAAFKATRIDVLAATEQRAKQASLCVDRRLVIDGCAHRENTIVASLPIEIRFQGLQLGGRADYLMTR